MTSRQFSIPTVLRMVPNEILGQVFERLGHGDLGICWTGLKEREVEPVLKAISILPRHKQDRIEGALRNLFALACESGIDAIFEAALKCGDLDLPKAMPRETGPYAKAAWAWLHRPDAFEKAVLIHQVDNLSWWRKRRDLPQIPSDTSAEALDRIGQAISDLLLIEQGRGQACTVEHFSRSDGTDYFFAHPDDFVQNVTAHDDDGKLTPQILRQTFVMVFAFNADEGSLELFARLAVPMGDRGCLSLFGDNAETHRLFAEHLTSEYRVKTQGRGRTVDEWKMRPERGDNHWFDGLVGCAVAASMQGVVLNGTEAIANARQSRISFAEMQRRRRG